MWKNKKCKTKCDLFKGDDSKNCEKVKGCKLTGKEKCKKKKKKEPKGECSDLSTKKCGKRDDCVIIEDGSTSTCTPTACVDLSSNKCWKRDDCVLIEMALIEDGGVWCTCAENGPETPCGYLGTYPEGTSQCDERDDCVMFEDCVLGSFCQQSF